MNIQKDWKAKLEMLKYSKITVCGDKVGSNGLLFSGYILAKKAFGGCQI